MCDKEYQNKFVLNNVCPLCEGIFKTRVTATQHFQRSIQQGRCIGKSREKHPIVAPESLQCKICMFTGSNLLDIYTHFREHHFDFVDVGHLAQTNFNSSDNP